MSGVNYPYGYQYETVAASQTAQVLGGTGAKGDYLHKLIISVVTVATADVTLLDGSTSIVIVTGNAANVPGIYQIPLEIYSVNGPWKITTGAGSTVIGIGKFSA